jgi:hypothetical protein
LVESNLAFEADVPRKTFFIVWRALRTTLAMAKFFGNTMRPLIGSGIPGKIKPKKAALVLSNGLKMTKEFFGSVASREQENRPS